MPAELFAVPDRINYADQLEISIPLMAASRLLDQLEFERAREAYESIYEHKDEIIGLYVREIECELVFLRLVAGDIEGARQLLTPDLRNYIETYRQVMSSKERILCAIALILDGDRTKAEEIYANLARRQADYLLQGEVKSDIEVMKSVFPRL